MEILKCLFPFPMISLSAWDRQHVTVLWSVYVIIGQGLRSPHREVPPAQYGRSQRDESRAFSKEHPQHASLFACGDGFRPCALPRLLLMACR